MSGRTDAATDWPERPKRSSRTREERLYCSNKPGFSGVHVAVNKHLILSVLQLGMLGAVLYVLLDTDGESRTPEFERPAIGRAESVQELRPGASAATVDAEAIRQIVRFVLVEFAAQLPGPAAAPESDESVIDPSEKDARLSEVKERVAFYRSVGQISDREIDEIQRSMSTLDPESQRAVLSELFREINAGNVKVRPATQAPQSR